MQDQVTPTPSATATEVIVTAAETTYEEKRRTILSALARLQGMIASSSDNPGLYVETIVAENNLSASLETERAKIVKNLARLGG